ncbi:MAG: Xaa-Pro peptidase family protein [Pseudomonadota bacterium]|nr:Xaa-Pro peptidase family protein [Pseudomonadota bacterium]
MSKVHEERSQRLQDVLAEAGLDGLMVYGNAWRVDYLRYATDFSVLEGDAIGIVLAGGETHIIVEGPVEGARAAAAHPDATVITTDDLVGTASARIKAFGNHQIAMAPADLMPFGLATNEAAAGLEDGTALMDALMRVKSPVEVETIRRATEMADRGYEVFVDAAKPGRAEFEVVAEIEGFFRAEGAQENFMLIGSGGVEVRGMHPAGTRRIQAGDLVTTELSPCVDGYFSQLCRTLVVGEPTELQLRSFTVFQDAVDAGFAVLKAGVTAGEVAKAENDVFRARGLGKYTTSEYTRVRGHSLGLFVDSKPPLLEDVDTVLEAGAFLIIHPNTYHPDAGYMVLGDAAVVTEDGYTSFSGTPRELVVSAI